MGKIVDMARSTAIRQNTQIPCPDLASELGQPGHHALTQAMMSWSLPGLIEAPPCQSVTPCRAVLCEALQEGVLEGSPSRKRHSCSLVERVVSCLHKEPQGGSLGAE